jgi:hypothetical protein
MKIYFQREDHCDTYLCFDPQSENHISLPENISLENFLFFLQGSLDQIRPVIIAQNETAISKADINLLKSTHCTFGDDFIFLNYSIRNSLKLSLVESSLHDFAQIRISLEKLLKK